MLKNAYLSLSFTLLSWAPISGNVPTPETSTALELIAESKKIILLEMKTALILKEKAKKHFQDTLQDRYENTQRKCLQVLKLIASSPEFASTLEQVTDEQARLITQEMVKYNDIIVDPSAYPLEHKVETELAIASFNAQEEQLFNIFYVVFAIISGSKMLINKLGLAEKELNAELVALEQ